MRQQVSLRHLTGHRGGQRVTWQLVLELRAVRWSSSSGNGMLDPDGPAAQAAHSRHFLMHAPATVPEPGAGLAILIATGFLARRDR